MSNEFEQLGRAKKVRALLTCLDRNFIRQGLNPYTDGAGIAIALSSWSNLEWFALARAIEINPPSATTVAEVIDEYRNRAAKDGMRALCGGV